MSKRICDWYNKSSLNYLLTFLLILTPGLMLWSFVLGRLYPIHLTEQVPFFFDLIEMHKSIPRIVIYFLGLINFLLIWLLAKKILSGWKALVPPLVFSLSPWSAYLIVAGSLYIYLLSLIMFAFFGLLLLKSKKIKLGTATFIIGSLMSIYSSLLMLIIFPLVIIVLVLNKFIDFKTIRYSVFLIILFCLPLFILMIKNQVGLKNIYNNQVKVFSNPGFLSASNQFQGESQKAGMAVFAKLTENKYQYISKVFLLKSIKHLTPSTFFTPQEKLLTFSFSPPIFFGFLTPFLYGLYLILCTKTLRYYLLSCLVLIIPSLFSKFTVDLNRLVLLEPVIVFVISFGLIKFIENQEKRYRVLLLVTILLVVAQFLVTISDIDLREYPRYMRYFGGRLEIGEQ